MNFGHFSNTFRIRASRNFRFFLVSFRYFLILCRRWAARYSLRAIKLLREFRIPCGRSAFRSFFQRIVRYFLFIYFFICIGISQIPAGFRYDNGGHQSDRRKKPYKTLREFFCFFHDIPCAAPCRITGFVAKSLFFAVFPFFTTLLRTSPLSAKPLRFQSVIFPVASRAPASVSP